MSHTQGQLQTPDDLPRTELLNLLYCNYNPNPATICSQCMPLIGHVFVPGTEPSLPAHPHCYCGYEPTELRPTGWTSEDLLPDGYDPDNPDPYAYDMKPGCMGWIWKVVELVKAGLTIPATLMPLLPFALFIIALQEQREEEEDEAVGEPPSEGPNEPRNRGTQSMNPTPQSTRTAFREPALTQSLYLQPVDADTVNGHRAYLCLFIGAGRVRRTDGAESNWLIPAGPLQEAAHLFEGVSSYIDHPSMFGFGWHQEPSLRDLAGLCLSPAWDEEQQGVAGIMRLYDDDPNGAGAMIGALYDQILADRAAGQPTPGIGLSAVLWHSSHMSETEDLEITDHIAQIDSVDHVYSAGARGYVREALARVGWG